MGGLVNEENKLPLYEMLNIMLGSVGERLSQLEKLGYKKGTDMDETFHTIIHASKKLEVQELTELREQLSKMLGSAFVK